MGSEKKSKKERKRSRSRSPSDRRKHEKKSKRERVPSTSSSGSASSEADFDRKLEEHRKKSRKIKKVDKKKRKEAEAPEEKRARRLAKKLKKEQEKQAKSEEGYLPPAVVYTNMNNPFNDPKLTDTFVWGKKLATEGRTGLSKKELEKETRERVRKNLYEMEELKRSRDARVAAKEDYDMIKRDQEKQAYGDWDQKEAEFQLKQAKMRSKLRIEQNRAKPIDLLVRYVSFSEEKTDSKDRDADAEFELVEPIKYMKGLSHEDFEDLFEDIKVCRKIDGNKNVEFWSDIKTIADDEFRKLAESRNRDSLHSSVQSEVEKIFKGKNISELSLLQTQVTQRIRQAGPGTDIDYWENLLKHLAVHIAKSRIRELHQRNLQLKLKRIREDQIREAEESGEAESSSAPRARKIKEEEEEERQRERERLEKEANRSRSHSPEPSGSEQWNRPKVNVDGLEDADLDEQEKEEKWKQLNAAELEEATIELYSRGGYTPTYGDPDDTMPGIEVLDEEEDAAKLLERRKANKKAPEGMSASEAAMMALAKKGMDKDEGTFAVEIPVEAQQHLWSDKYRPRKPRYLNRVQTGFEWNKYNQTHYDMDNPPPKIVQGYKFNIFYPDLLDVADTPSFQVFPDPTDADFATIRFHAGPPYEDIAFKIVNREWDVLHKNGYKCQFQNGVFQLWFMFKKYRYRR